VAVGLEIVRADAELFLGNVEDWPLLSGLGDFDVGLRRLMLRGGNVLLIRRLWGKPGKAVMIYPVMPAGAGIRC